MKQLVIAEKPSVARDLAQILGAKARHKNYYEGNKYVVTWSLGHLLGLKMPEDINPKWQKWELTTLPMIPKKFGIKPLAKTRAQLAAIGKLSKRPDVSAAVIATDAGREGELVARWILQYVNFKKPVLRLWISSQTTKAVREGFAHLKPAKAYDDLYHSALARAQADWLVGLNVSRALTVKYQDSLSAGRVQTPTLALVAKQAEKINRFKPQTYYQVQMKWHDHQATLRKPHQFKDRAAAEKMVASLQKQTGVIQAVSAQTKKTPAPLPYDLTQLQREANVAYGYSAKKTLNLVQSLYEHHKVVSYPRTDSQYLSTDLKATLKDRLLAMKNVAPAAVTQALQHKATPTHQTVFNNAKVTDHHALIPTEQQPDYSKFSNDESRIYQMIAKRFVALFMPDYTVKRSKAQVSFPNAQFEFSSEQVVTWGFKPAGKTQTLVNWQKGTTVVPDGITVVAKQTTPPSPLTEASLLALMEKYGLGTPATRAEIIEKLINTDLLARSGKHLQVQPKGKQLLQLVNPALVTPELTAKWEQQLEQIARGKYQAPQFIAQITHETRRLVNEIKNSTVKYQDYNLTNKVCPECGKRLKEKNSRNGKMLVCSNPTCKYRRRAEAKVTNHRCPKCHKKMLLLEKNNQPYFRCQYDGTTEKVSAGGKRSKKMTRRETNRVMKKLQAEQDEQESPLAAALKAALNK